MREMLLGDLFHLSAPLVVFWNEQKPPPNITADDLAWSSEWFGGCSTVSSVWHYYLHKLKIEFGLG